ncbi:DEHA2D15202p [Debaryomyces hansenii CBS767]|uniref:DEHA2D15202p n=1 Tax=Debaryomyces hansenii (strain ATCC 36239 / CBS 767 / BCRC 21394 / JCM 1990 / NBRC 0083 / IGC 2968) TaxID=284592 RepID=Q6BRM7_DEBHA|nr:DEHA2D15202p [Debaryomyces hansenii CBS767]CAG87314.1 DEHA2D15202p [Debaryomyces hansenii CBS767]|eukprot:XP_459143.1 DEHA2D15202p [Debaryomyces hansenii CBS767]
MLRWRINGEAIYSADCTVSDSEESRWEYGSDAPLEHDAFSR